MSNNLKFIISGGGTGGHIFPAVSIANALKKKCPDAEILFVGAEGRMEMEKVPQAGYQIKGLPIMGMYRGLKNIFKNFKVAYRLLKSNSMAMDIVKEFKPDAAIGVGGYASYPTLHAANKQGIPTFLQEQNGFAGKANIRLGKYARKICVAFDNMDRFFPKEAIIKTGNPVRQNLSNVEFKDAEALKAFGLSKDKKTLLIIGGSLGAKTVNDSIAGGLEKLKNAGIQVIWQTGKTYYADCKAKADSSNNADLKCQEFVYNMDQAYAVADLVISRAGASSISELCLLGKASILVPSPNVTEDHQTKNALALSTKDAAILIKDAEAKDKLVDTALQLLADESRLEQMSKNALALAERDSADRIADIILTEIGKK